jgi:hypothetical protein
MNRDSPELAQVDTPLITKQNHKVILSKLITTITNELKDYVVKNDSRVRSQFFGVDHRKDFGLDKKKIVEKAQVQLRQVKRTVVSGSLYEGIKQISLVLLAAKLQSLALYMDNGEKPIILDRCLDNCLNSCQRQVNRFKNEPNLLAMFVSLLRHNQVEAILAIYKQYDQKVVALSASITDETALQKVMSFHRELVASGEHFAGKVASFSAQQTQEDFSRLLKEERHRIMSLEPETDHFETPELYKTYQWAIKAVSKLGGYIKSLNDQMSQLLIWEPDTSKMKP